MPKYPPTMSPSKSLVKELPLRDDLGGPLSDEDDAAAYKPTEPLSPVPGVVHTWSADTEMVIKSEPVDDVEGLASESHQLQPASESHQLLPLQLVEKPFQLVEHSYSSTDHIGMCSSDYTSDLDIVEEESTSRTSGYKWVSEDDCSRYADDGTDRHGMNVAVRLRKKCAPLITSRLIIPVVRVAQSTLTEKNLMENDTSAVHNNLDKRVDGEILLHVLFDFIPHDACATAVQYMSWPIVCLSRLYSLSECLNRLN